MNRKKQNSITLLSSLKEKYPEIKITYLCKKELADIKKSLLEKEKPDWQDKNKLENFLDKQKQLEQNLEQLQKLNEKTQKENNQFDQQSEEILQKQELLNKLFEELMSDEMKKLYEELQKMMEKMEEKLEADF